MRQINIAIKNQILGYLKKDISKIDYNGLLAVANQGKYRYTNEDILNFFVEYQYNNFIKNSEISSNIIGKMALFVHFILFQQKPEKMDDLMISKIIKLEEEYKNFCQNKNMAIDENIIKCYQECSSCFKVKEQNKTAEEILEFNKTIMELQNENKNLSEQNASLTKKIDKSENEKAKAVAKKEEKIAVKEEEIKTLKKEIKSLKSELEKYKNTVELSKEEQATKMQIITDLNAKITEYETLVASLKVENQLMINRNMELNNKVNHLENSPVIKQEQTNLKNMEIDKAIIDHLVAGKYTANELVNILNGEGIECTFEMVFEALNRVQKIINIEPTGEITVPKYYEAQTPELVSDKKVIMNPINGGYKDILFISDIHFNNDEDENYYSYRRLYGIYDYCTEKGIDTIINLGDTLDNDLLVNNKSKANYEIQKKQLETVASNLNHNEIINSNVNQLILGGNHDQNFAMYGIDPIKYLASTNPSFIPIGYNDARINIAGTNDYIGLHHAGVPREESLNYDNQKITAQTLEYLKNYYRKIGLDQSKVYFDFFGHTHKGKVDPQNGYSIIPSFGKDRFTDGATKVRIFFDVNGNIDYLLIYPLSIGRRMQQISEIPYQKQKAL